MIRFLTQKKRLRSHFLAGALLCSQALLNPAAPSAIKAPSWRDVVLYREELPAPPASLAKALSKELGQGYRLMSWEVSPAGQGYMVDLYHFDPRSLGADRQDFRDAAALGRGISIRKFVRASVD